jgi:pimeloyl-ACP methyl ester carboxylesterase
VARAAAFEHRVAAIILGDGVFDFSAAFRDSLPPFLSWWITEGRDDAALPVLAMLTQLSGHMRWALNNGIWAMGAASPVDLIRKSADYTLDGVAERIVCPTLILGAENDQFLKGQPQLVEKALSAPATLVTLTEAEGAGEHCHVGALSRSHAVIFDWLDGTLAR